MIPETNPSPATLEIDVDIAAGGWRERLADPDAAVARALGAAWRFLDGGGDAWEVSVLLTDDARQRELNRDWRGKDKPTNVLSFPAADDDGPALPAGVAAPLGDVSLAFETLVREAETGGVSFDDHFSHLLVHGMLHLMGYDHETAADAERMEGLETEILASLGIDDPYAGDVSGAED